VLAEQTLRWFSPQHDRDQDGLPEWPNPDYARLTDLPNFNVWQEESFPTRISSAESLGLAILLSNELETLQRMTRVLGNEQLSAQIRPYQDASRQPSPAFAPNSPTPPSSIATPTASTHQKIIEVKLPILIGRAFSSQPPPG
jgi:hypothetical protein